MSLERLIGSHLTKRFNLGSEPWLPVTDLDGVMHAVGFEELLRNAHMYQGLALTGSPLTYYAVMRYLFTLGYLLHAESPYEDVWMDVARKRAPLPQAAVEAITRRFEDHWWLFHPDTPFFQIPALPSFADREPKESDTVETVTDPFAVLLPHVPAKSNPAWFYKQDGSSAPTASSNAQAVLGLMTRHVFASPGNEARVRVEGALIRNTPGGCGLVGPRSVTHMVNTGPTLAATLALNLTVSGTDKVAPTSVTFFEDPLHPERHMSDWLYAYSASGASSFLPEGHPDRVLRGPLPVPKETVKLLMTRARLQDPHPIRILKRKGTTQGSLKDVTYVLLDPERTMFEWVNRLLQDGVPAEMLVCPMLTPSDLACKPPGGAVTAVSVKTSGSATGVKVAAAALMPFEARYLAADNVSAQHRVRDLFNAFGGSSKSVSKALARCVNVVLAGRKSNGEPRKSVSAKAVADAAQQAMWELMSGDLRRWLDAIISDDPPPLRDLLLEARGIWPERIGDLAASVLEPFGSTARFRAETIREVSSLRGVIWSLLTRP